MDYSMARLPEEPTMRMPRGSIVALITPFTKDGKLDVPALRRLVDFHIEKGTAALAVTGTTGEASTLSQAEHHQVIAVAVEQSAGRIHVMAGVGANSTAEAIELARFAAETGADSLLSVVPYYVKPSQKGMVEHFIAQADAVEIPIVLYSVPGRTVVDMSVDTVVVLANHRNICGLKDATGDMARAVAIVEAVPQDFCLYSGDDFSSFPYLVLGGHGVISVVANVEPARVARLCTLVKEGRIEQARQEFIKLQPLMRALFAETSPGPVKYAASLLGQCEPKLRLPLHIPEAGTCLEIEHCMKGGRADVA